MDDTAAYNSQKKQLPHLTQNPSVTTLMFVENTFKYN